MFRNRLIFHLMLDDFEEDEGDVNRRSLFDYNRYNYHLNAPVFRRTFRVDCAVFIQIEQIIGQHLIWSNRNNSLTPRQRILTALNFLGNGTRYQANGLIHGVSTSTVCRCVHRVCFLIYRFITPLFLRFPDTSRIDERNFFRKARFPNIKGVIDGTLIYIDAPREDEAVYVCRNNRHAINLLVVSGPQNRFYYASASSPGSFHDSRCLWNSSLWQAWQLEHFRPDNDDRSIILGDSAYPLTSWLIPPNVRAVNAHVRQLANAVPRFERAHKKTRFIVECSIGIVKNEYPCLKYLRIKEPRDASKIIYSCLTLHNMQNIFHRGNYDYDEELFQLANQEPPPLPAERHQNIVQHDVNGINRQKEILEYFASLP